jgi:hypothetical protein
MGGADPADVLVVSADAAEVAVPEEFAGVDESAASCDVVRTSCLPCVVLPSIGSPDAPPGEPEEAAPPPVFGASKGCF